MQILNIFLLSLATLSLAAPAPAQPRQVAEPRTDIEDVHTAEVIVKMENELGTLDWTSLKDGGKSVLIPREQWEHYASIVKTEDEAKKEQENSLEKRGTPITGGMLGHYAERGCYPTGSFGAAQDTGTTFTTDVTTACNQFQYNLAGGLVQVVISAQRLSYTGETMQWYFKFQNFGVINPTWTSSQCKIALKEAAIGCGTITNWTRGGWVDVWTGPSAASKGAKAYSYTSDPTTLSCNC